MREKSTSWITRKLSLTLWCHIISTATHSVTNSESPNLRSQFSTYAASLIFWKLCIVRTQSTTKSVHKIYSLILRRTPLHLSDLANPKLSPPVIKNKNSNTCKKWSNKFWICFSTSNCQTYKIKSYLKRVNSKSLAIRMKLIW